MLNVYKSGPQGAAVPLTQEQQMGQTMSLIRAEVAALSDKLRDIRTLCEIARVERQQLRPEDVLSIVDAT